MKNTIIQKSVLILTFFLSLLLVYNTNIVYAAPQTPSKISKLTISNDGNVITLKWSKSKNTKKYQVYEKKGKKFKLIATTKKNKYSKKVKPGTYSFKIRGVNGKKYGKYSKTKSIMVIDDGDFQNVDRVWEIKDGYYTAGVDIPAGKFDITPTGGIGYVSSDEDSANLCSSGYDSKKYGEYANSYKNYKLKKGEILEVQGVQIKITYSVVSSDVIGRVYDNENAIELSAGNYEVGKDLVPGRYNVKYVSGEGGYVSSNRSEGECILSSNIDGDSKTDEYVDCVSNVLLEQGEVIEVTSGLTVLFVPEKSK